MDNNKSQLIDLWRTSFNDSEEFIKLFFDRVYKKRKRPVLEKKRKNRFRPSNASVCHDLLRKGDIRKLYIWSLHSSLRTRSGTYAPTDTESIRSDGKPESGLNSHYPGRSMAVRLLPRFRIYGSFRLFRRNVYLPF